MSPLSRGKRPRSALLSKNAMRCFLGAVAAFLFAGCRDTPVESSDGGSAHSPDYAKRSYYNASVGSAINTQGQIVGWSGDFPFLAFLWTPRRSNGSDGTMVSLGSLGGNESEAWDINTQGQVVGDSKRADGAVHAFLWTPKRANGPSGTMVDLGTLGGSQSRATGINTQGQVVGWSYMPGNTTTHAFLWKPTTSNGATGTMYDLGTLNGLDSYAAGINTQGQVAGGSGGHFFLWNPATANGTTGTLHDLGGGNAQGMNTQGQIVGSSGARAFLWTPATANGTTGSAVDLGELGGGNVIGAFNINTQGQVVGYQVITNTTTGNPDYHAFLWTPTTSNGSSGTMIDLGTLGTAGAVAYDINTQGQVAGWSKTSDNLTHGFLWTPATSNGSAGAMADIGTLQR